MRVQIQHPGDRFLSEYDAEVILVPVPTEMDQDDEPRVAISTEWGLLRIEEMKR